MNQVQITIIKSNLSGLKILKILSLDGAIIRTDHVAEFKVSKIIELIHASDGKESSINKILKV